MKRYILELTEDDEAELISEESDESIWSSYDDDDFDGDPGDDEAVTDYLVRKGIVESENEIVEVVDETGQYAALDDDDDDDDDELAEDDDDD